MKLSFRTLFYPLASCAFLLLLLLPLGDNLLRLTPPVEDYEMRTLAKKPEWRADSASRFPKAFDAYYGDHFGFRWSLIRLGSRIKYFLFHSSPTPDKVSLGKDDWLFLTGRFYRITQDLSRENRYAPDSLAIAVAGWEQRRQELAQRHIGYYKAVWPDKHYIYPEFLSFGMQQADCSGPHRCDQALDYLEQVHSSLPFIDVRAELLQAKKNIRLYHKDDSHWNAYGAFFGYTKLVNRLSADFPQLKPYPFSDFKVEWKTKELIGDLASIINLDWHEKEPVFSLHGRPATARSLEPEGYPLQTQIWVNPKASTSLRALVYRDSFTTALIPFLMLHFKEIVFIWDTDYSLSMVERVKPDIVIECYVSRYFR